jgi:hypothetical protein
MHACLAWGNSLLADRSKACQEGRTGMHGRELRARNAGAFPLADGVLPVVALTLVLSRQSPTSRAPHQLPATRLTTLQPLRRTAAMTKAITRLLQEPGRRPWRTLSPAPASASSRNPSTLGRRASPPRPDPCWRTPSSATRWSRCPGSRPKSIMAAAAVAAGVGSGTEADATILVGKAGTAL